MSRRLLVAVLLLVAGCGAHGAAAHEPQLAADGSWRLPAPGGSFASWNERFPEELEAVVRGDAQAVEVWAGLEEGSLDTPTPQRR